MADKIISVEQLKQKVDTVKTELADLKKETSEDILDKKKKTTNEKIEATKKEIQAKLDALKVVWIDLQTAETQAEIKELEEMLVTLNTSSTEISSLEEDIQKEIKKEVEKIAPADETKTDLAKDISGDKPDKKGWFAEKWDWVKANPWKTALFATGIGALAYWLYSWLKPSHENSSSQTGSWSWEKMSRWKKLLIAAWIVSWWAFVWSKWGDNIKNWFSSWFWEGNDKDKDKDKDKESVDDFEDLSEEIKKKYYILSWDIDTYPQSSEVIFSDDDTQDKTKKAAILFGLDNESKNLYDFSTNGTLNYMEGKGSDNVLEIIWNWTKEKMSLALYPFLSKIASFSSFMPDFVKNPIDTFNAWLKTGQPWEHEKELAWFYREYMNVIGYVTEKKRLLEEKLAKEEIMGKSHLNDASTKEQQDQIDDLLENKTRITWKVDSFFKKYNLSDLPWLTKTYGILPSDISLETQKVVTNLEKENNKVLQKDDTWETVVTRAETDFLDGSLEEDSREELIDMCEDLLDLEFGDRWFFGGYTHLITDIFAGNTEMTKDFLEKAKIGLIPEEFKATLTWYITKLKANTFSKEDLQKFKTQSETYLEAKNTYELFARDAHKMSAGLHFDMNSVGKILSLPWNAVKDIGKAFGMGKASSWRERIWSGFWGFMVSWWVLYITWTAAKLWRLGVAWELLQIGGKYCFKLWTLPITLVKEWVVLASWRTFLTSSWWSEAILNPAFSSLEKERLVKYAFLRGEISEHKALVLYEKIGNPPAVTSLEEILERCGIKDPKYRTLFKKYSGNKNVKDLLFDSETFKYMDWKENLKHTFKDRILKKNITINENNFKKLLAIDEHLWKIAPSGTKEAAFWESFLKNAKTLDRVEDLIKNKKIMWMLVDVGSTTDDYLKLSKLLAKNFHKFKTLDEFEWYINFLKTQKWNIKNTNTFVSNTVGKRAKIRTMDGPAQAKYIETKELNISFLDRRINAMKNNFQKSAETLRKMVREWKTPYPQTVNETADGLGELAKTSNEDLTLLAESERVGTGNWQLAMSKNTNLIKELSPLFKDEAFLKELSALKTEKAVKDLLASKWIRDIPQEFASALARTSSTKKIADTMRYVERYESLSKIWRILKSPGMKYAGRVLWRVLGIGTVVLWGFLAYDTYQKWSELKHTNKERGELMQDESIADVGLAIAWACAFVPGIWWIAWWVIILATTVATVVKEAVFDTMDKYNKNYKDFITSAPLLIKQHILTTALGSWKEDRGFGDWLVWSMPQAEPMMKYLAAKTWSEGIKALLYAEEWKKNQLASLNMNNEADKLWCSKQVPIVTAENVWAAIDQTEKNVEARYEYLKKKCGAYILEWNTYINVQKIVTLDKIKNGQWMQSLDQLLLESEYALSNPDLYGDPQKLEQQQKETKLILDQDPTRFTLLEWLFAKDRQSLLYMYRYLPDYTYHLKHFWFDATGVCIEKDYDLIVKNMDYFGAYMRYKTLEQWIDVVAYSNWFPEPNLISTRNFFAHFSLDNLVSGKELYASQNKLQTILYRIATEVIWAKINNTMDDIKAVFDERNEKMYWIYFDNGKLNVNGNYFSDTQYAGTDVATIKTIRTDIQEQMTAGDLVDVWTGDTYLNKEIWNKYLAIIDQELVRA